MLINCEIQLAKCPDPQPTDWLDGWDWIPLHVDEKVESYMLQHGAYDFGGGEPSWTFEGEALVRLDDYMMKFYDRPFLTTHELDLPKWASELRYVLFPISHNRGVTVIT